MSLHPPSEEQSIIINTVKQGKNVIIQAVPGAGKTTTMMNIATELPDKNILLLTYNSLLKTESRQKSVELELANLEIHTFHSWVKKYIDDSCFDDVSLYETLPSINCEHVPHYDIIVVDEAQDLKKLYYDFVMCLLSPETQLILSGDPMQSIYRYDGATTDYLLNKDNLWGREFTKHSLQYSYRLTRPMAEFINEAVLGKPLIKAVKEGPPVTYIICNSYNVKYIKDIILHHKKEGVPDGEFFIGNFSLKLVNRDKPIHKLENSLVRHRLRFYRPMSDSSENKDLQLRDKIALTTWHQSKGRERSIVVVYGADESFYLYYNKGKEYTPHQCPEPLYVKLTRASSQLYIIQDQSYNPLPFFKKTLEELTTKPYFKLVDLRKPGFIQKPIDSTPPSTIVATVKDFCSRLGFEQLVVLKKCVKSWAKELPTQGVKDIHIPTMVSTRDSTHSMEGMKIILLYSKRLE